MNYSIRRLGDVSQEFLLFNGTFVLGSHEDDDISLDGNGVVSHHVRFVAAEEDIFMLGSNAPVYIDGLPVTMFPSDWTAGSVLSLSEDVHFYLGRADDALPEAPTLKIAKASTEKSATLASFPWQKVLLNLLPIGIILILTAAILLTMRVSFSSSVVTPKLSQSQEVVKVSATAAKTYFETILGDHLLSYEETTDHIEIRVLEASPEKMVQWDEDIDRILPKIDKDVDITVVNERELVFRVQRDLKALLPGKTIETHRRTVTVKGACMTAQCPDIHAKIASVKSPDVKIIDQVHEVKTGDLKILSLTVSQNSAQATLSRQGVIAVVSENGRVFDIGTLRLIRQDGIDIHTPYGPIFLPWSRS